MKNNRGYIYVLANSAMPDLVKVGKTTRTPAERAAELSKVTGVPTPFIVVYEQLVDDCTAAEEFVHTMLQQKGYRESDNREFFRAPVSEVVRAVISMPNQISNDLKLMQTESEHVDSEKEIESYPWLEMWNMAENYHYGKNLCIVNFKEAEKFYEKSVKLGCISAYLKLGEVGREIQISSTRGSIWDKYIEKMFEWYKQGAVKGNYYCYLKMANFLKGNDAEECFELFLKNKKIEVTH